jgi:hypothetical protein
VSVCVKVRCAVGFQQQSRVWLAFLMNDDGGYLCLSNVLGCHGKHQGACEESKSSFTHCLSTPNTIKHNAYSSCITFIVPNNKLLRFHDIDRLSARSSISSADIVLTAKAWRSPWDHG